MSIAKEKEKELTEAARARIFAQYKRLCDGLSPNITKKERSAIDTAFAMAFKAHAGVFRKSKDPYIVHPLNVAQIVSEELKLGAICVISALLHDVVEDTDVRLKDIEKEFGKQVAGIVDGLTKIDRDFLWYKSKQAANFQKLLRYITQDSRIILVKLADRLDNMRAVHFLPKIKQWRIASETKLIYAPIAHRLGLSKLKTELEELYLKTVDPERYHEIGGKIQKSLKEQEQELIDFVKPIEAEMRSQGLKFRVKTRTKSIYSIYNKIKEKNIKFNEIYDFVAVRIILDEVHEKVRCWQTYGIVTSLYTANTKRKKDWISTPRSNGYESLHITVLSDNEQWVEVQIRTERMNEIASRGIASHWKYKEKRPNPLMAGFDKWLGEMSKLVSAEKNSLAAMNQLEMGLYTEEMHVFDRKGKVIILPKGATVLDFAVEELEERGLHCDYALVNEQVVPPYHVLKNGDHVHVEINEKIVPEEKALKYVATAKAVRVLRLFFKEKREKNILLGQKQLADQFAKYKVAFIPEIVEQFKEFLGEEIIEDVYYKIGQNLVRDLSMVVEKFMKTLNKADLKKIEKGENFLLNRKETLLIGEDNRERYEISDCCSPIPGEEIFGIIMANQVVKVHSMHCKDRNKVLSRYGSRMISVEWYNPALVEVSFYIRAVAYKELTKNMLNILKLFDVQALLLDKTKLENEVEGNIYLAVRDIKEVVEFMRKMKAVRGIRELVKNKKLPAR